MSFRPFIFLLIPALLASAALADDTGDEVSLRLAEAQAAYKAEDFETAARLLFPLAVQGLAEAQYLVGRMYSFGEGVPEDSCIATLWFDKAARQGHPGGAALLGYNYSTGQGVRKTPELAYRWMIYAESLGDNWAARNREFVGRHLSQEERARIREDMAGWRPQDQPAADIFVHPEDLLEDYETKLELRLLGLEGCFVGD